MSGYTPHHLSASQISEYVRCPAHYRFNRLEKMGSPQTPPMAWGSALHLALRAYHEERDEYREFVKWWEISEQQLRGSGTYVSEQFTGWGLKLLAAYAKTPAPDGRSEQSYTVDVPGIPVPIVVIFDLEHDTGVTEFKCSLYAWNQERPAKEFQLALYETCFPIATGRRYEEGTYVNLFANPRPAIQRMVVPGSTERVERTIETTNVVLNAMKAGVWTPRCPKGACSYPQLCGRTDERETERHETARLVRS